MKPKLKIVPPAPTKPIDRSPHVSKRSPYAAEDPFKHPNAGLFWEALNWTSARARES